MACVRLHQDKWKADFRDQFGRRRLEAPRGPFFTKAEERNAAKDLLAARLIEVRAGRYQYNRENLTLADLADQYLESKTCLRASTRADYVIEIDAYLKPYFGPRIADEITAREIETFRKEMCDKVPEVIQDARKRRHPHLPPLHPGPRVINRVLTRLSSIMKYGLRHKLITANTALGIERVPTVKSKRRIQDNVLPPNELQLLIDHTTYPWRPPIMTAVYTGMRRAELAGLQWTDINWDARTARIERSYRRGAFYPPKTESSQRVVELPDTLIDELKQWQRQCPQNPHNLVFPTLKGKPMDGNDLLRTGFRPALRRAGLREIRFHDLRHAFASNLLAAGWDVVTVSRLMGHANPQITLTIYAHALPRSRHGAADALAALMRETPVPTVQPSQ